MDYRKQVIEISKKQYDLFVEKMPIETVGVLVFNDDDTLVENRGFRCYTCLKTDKYLQTIPSSESYFHQKYEDCEILLCDECRDRHRIKKETMDKSWKKRGIFRSKDCKETIDFDVSEHSLIEALTSFDRKLLVADDDAKRFLDENDDLVKKNVMAFLDLFGELLAPTSNLSIALANMQYLNDTLVLLTRKFNYFNQSLHQLLYQITNNDLKEDLLFKFTNKLMSNRPFVSSFPKSGQLIVSRSVSAHYNQIVFKYSSAIQLNRFKPGDMFVLDFLPCRGFDSSDSLTAGIVLESTSLSYLVAFPNGQFHYIPHFFLRYCDLKWTDVFKIGTDMYTLVNSFISNYPSKVFVRLKIDNFYKIDVNNTLSMCRVISTDKDIALIRFKNGSIKTILPLREYFLSGQMLCEPMMSVQPKKKIPARFFGQRKRFEFEIGPDLNNESSLATETNTKARRRRCVPCSNIYDGVSMIQKSNLYKMSIFAIPGFYGWSRRLMNHRISYVSPCRKNFHRLIDIQDHIWWFDELDVEYFTFEEDVKLKRRLSYEKSLVLNKDLSCKTEYYPISVYNDVDQEQLKIFLYSSSILNNISSSFFNNDFKTCCDCENDCVDQKKCACRMLTVKHVLDFRRRSIEKTDIIKMGYCFKRLLENVESGIYECNSSCKCSSKCVNRLVQYPTKIHFQVFKTERCGWGVRVLHDVPEGAFLGVYTGELLYGHMANDHIIEDTYLADLDFIEVAENNKEHYEVEYGIINDTSDEKKSDELEERETVRKFYQENTPYVIDGKMVGNIGRFFNHSCDPNLFVQNVFIETHDLRFPHVAFFASRNLVAGQEITWDYSYEVGSVLGKRIDCHCGAKKCRGRLL